MRQRLVSSKLVTIGDARQWLSKFGVERGKIEVLVCYGGERERERERNLLFWRRGKGIVAE